MKTNSKEQLFNAFLLLKSKKEVEMFCQDLMTDAEIVEFSGRLAVASELYLGNSQRQVSANTGVSIATVTRVNKWLTRGKGGYKLVLEKMHHTQQQ
jgi:TrpR-related protein YerC/YecD